ncbi:MAG TPA: hypothetical protein VN872_13210, partial [Candidatus Acidoferrum sp.]|nr:hypothetical protein [Candidatus Acidoferrum sp.]
GDAAFVSYAKDDRILSLHAQHKATSTRYETAQDNRNRARKGVAEPSLGICELLVSVSELYKTLVDISLCGF